MPGDIHGMQMNQKGFTLIEIIAVLVILGILAAVAIPKYMSIQGDAQNRSLQSAIAEGKSRVSLYAAQELIKTGSINSADFTNTNLGSGAGDFQLAFGAGNTVTISASGTGGSIPASVSTTATVSLPTLSF
jgi:prepilin-type N-terminal cleavage/methylation domain-containing protein